VAAAAQARTAGSAAEAGLKTAAVAVLAAALALSAAGTARADGDPASDVLYTQWASTPFGAAIPPEVTRRLDDVVQSARAAGYPIKVAVIASPPDLGTAYVLWRKPQEYAHFLGQELVFLYKGRLLVVMPNGYGLWRYKHDTTAERRALPKPSASSSASALVDSAVTAVARLAAANGHPVTVPPPARVSSSGSGGSKLMDRVIIGVAAAAFIVLAVLVPTLVRRRPRTTS
jgi:hypothetical protein